MSKPLEYNEAEREALRDASLAKLGKQPALSRLGSRQGTRSRIEMGFIKGRWTWESLWKEYDRLRNRKGPLPPYVALGKCFCVDTRSAEQLARFYFKGVNTHGAPLNEESLEFYRYLKAVMDSVDSCDSMLERWDEASVKMQSQDAWRHSAMTFPGFIEPLKSEREKDVVRQCVARALIRGQRMLIEEARRTADETLDILEVKLQEDREQAKEMLCAYVAEAYGRALTERD